MENTSNNQALIDLASGMNMQETPSAGEHGERPYVVVPTGYKVADLEHLLPNPTRKQGNIVTTDADSFIKYVMDEKSWTGTKIYANLDSETAKLGLVAVLNDHGTTAAQWRDHRCTYDPKLSLEWKRWSEYNRREMNQLTFASFIEDNIGDVVSVNDSPNGTQMLGMALAFERTANKMVASHVNLQSGGVRFEFVDDDTRQTKSAMEAFSRFNIGVPVFYGSESAYPVEARLKYREKDGKVIFWYELVRADRVFQTAAREVIQRIKDETAVTVLFGTP
jgi:uncharacterized protein YfdQ (DUF2303 family)